MKECEVSKLVFCSLFLLSLITHFLDFVDNVTYNNKISAIKMNFLVWEVFLIIITFLK